MDLEGGAPKALPPTLWLHHKHPMSQADRLGLESDFHVYRAPFPSVCLACTCTFKPCPEHGHPSHLVCYMCSWVMCEVCCNASACQLCSSNAEAYGRSLAVGRTIRCEGCKAPLPFGSFPQQCNLCGRGLCPQCVTIHARSCGTITSGAYDSRCEACDAFLPKGTAVCRCLQCGNYV